MNLGWQRPAGASRRADGVAELCDAEWAVFEGGEDTLFEGGAVGPGFGIADFEAQGVLAENEGERGWSGGGAVFDGEEVLVSAAAQIEIRVAPCMVLHLFPSVGSGGRRRAIAITGWLWGQVSGIALRRGRAFRWAC